MPIEAVQLIADHLCIRDALSFSLSSRTAYAALQARFGSQQRAFLAPARLLVVLPRGTRSPRLCADVQSLTEDDRACLNYKVDVLLIFHNEQEGSPPSFVICCMQGLNLESALDSLSFTGPTSQGRVKH